MLLQKLEHSSLDIHHLSPQELKMRNFCDVLISYSKTSSQNRSGNLFMIRYTTDCKVTLHGSHQ